MLFRSAGDGRPDAQEDEGEPGRPVSPSLKQETCFVFDWDDTILPTSWLERIHALAGGPLRPEVQRQLASLCSAVTQTLQIASTLGNIVIITNSAPGWVDQSCQIFMPQILQQIRSYPIYAKPMHAPLTFKITTFRRECKKFSNLISIGDGDAERAASLRLQAPSERRGPLGEESRQRVKSVKLVELPTCQQLIVQHEMLQVRLPDVTAFHGSLDLKSRFPTGSPQSKAGGPTLVHFGRPMGIQSVTSAVPPPAKVEAGISPRTPVSPNRSPGGQLPPLGAIGAGAGRTTPGVPPAETDAGASRRVDSGEQASGLSDRPTTPRTTAPTAIGEDALGLESREPSSRGSVGSPSALWKVQGVGPGRDGRTIFSAHKKRPVLAGVGVGGRPPASVWRDPVPGKGF